MQKVLIKIYKVWVLILGIFVSRILVLAIILLLVFGSNMLSLKVFIICKFVLGVFLMEINS